MKDSVVQAYWRAIVEREEAMIRSFFNPDAVIRWHNSNEQFTLDQFIVANCQYPGRWGCRVERVEQLAQLTICVVRIFSPDESVSFHVTSFMQLNDDKISVIDEYWGEDGVAPEWRKQMAIGSVIHRA